MKYSNIYMVKFTMFDKLKPLLQIKEFKTHKITDKRVYYYEIYDEDSNEDDITYINRDMFTKGMITQSDTSISSTMWCDKEELEYVKNKVKLNMRRNLENKIRRIFSSDINESNRSSIKI